MWTAQWRDQVWSEIDQPWDILIIGGGITGAGLLREAVGAGLRCLLVDAGDFSFGTSSRSSKLVHGGFRYLRNKQFAVTRESVREREWMMRQASYLVTPLPFLLPSYAHHHNSAKEMRLGVRIYDLLAPKWKHRPYTAEQMLKACPGANPEGLVSAVQYYDAQVDDSRLVLRMLREASQAGGTALNYARAERLLRDASGQVVGAAVSDTSGGGRSAEVKAKVVINAAGPWSDELRAMVGAPARLRKLRGSHLIFPREKLPIDQAITLWHPRDNRGMFIMPWEGTTMIGTTDLDHDVKLEQGGAEPYADANEIEYIMEGLRATLPGYPVEESDILSSFAGLRPIIRSGTTNDPSKESRAHVVWLEEGLLTVTGGKLTIFRRMAHEALRAASSRLSEPVRFDMNMRFFNRVPATSVLSDSALDMQECLRLLGRYGQDAGEMATSASLEDMKPVGNSNVLLAELKWAAAQEAVVHLDDLLLRRGRVGLLLPNGGQDELPALRPHLQPLLGWDDTRWEHETSAYATTWQRFYAPAPIG